MIRHPEWVLHSNFGCYPPKQFNPPRQPFNPQFPPFTANHSASFPPCYLSVSKPLKVILDIRYQYAIMASLSRHCPSVPSEPCAPATRSFPLPQYFCAYPLSPTESYHLPTPTL